VRRAACCGPAVRDDDLHLRPDLHWIERLIRANATRAMLALASLRAVRDHQRDFRMGRIAAPRMPQPSTGPTDGCAFAPMGVPSPSRAAEALVIIKPFEQPLTRTCCS
jgi:hypothetical protein